MATGIVLLFVLEKVWYLAISFVGAYFLIAFPTRLVKKNSYDIKDALFNMDNRNLMQEISYRYLCDKSIIVPLDVYETESDIGLYESRIGFIKHENIKDPKEAIYLDMDKYKFIIKYKKNKVTKYFKDYDNYISCLEEIKNIINNL